LTSQSPTANQQEIQHELDALFRLDEEDAGELLLVRHAEPASSPSDPMLSCDGLRQAERLAERLSSLWIDTIYSAPERRCFQTAKVIADDLQRPLKMLDELAEIGFDAELARGSVSAYVERFNRQPRWDALLGFDSGKDFRRRAVTAIESIIAAHPSRRTAVVTHSSVINGYLSMVLCIPRDQFFAPDYASISTLRHRAEMYGLRTLNDTTHLDLSSQIPGLPAALTPRSLPLTNR
jgi:2,3-bisphosphoglycerate-dependent phosphoglycerate mutase